MVSLCAIVVTPVSAELGVTLSSVALTTVEMAVSVLFRMDVLYAAVPALDTMVRIVNNLFVVQATVKMEESVVSKVEYQYAIALALIMMESTVRTPSVGQVTVRMEAVAL